MEARGHDPKRSTHSYFDYLVKLLKSTNGTDVIRPKQGMPDDEVSGETVVREDVVERPY